MEEFKIEHFKAKYGMDFPNFVHLTDTESEKIKIKLFNLFNVNNTSSLLTLILDNQICLININATENFSFRQVLNLSGIQSTNHILVNWYLFDNIDCFRLEDFNKYFSDIWYQGPDDIEIFDHTLKWIILIRHDGQISYLNNI